MLSQALKEGVSQAVAAYETDGRFSDGTSAKANVPGEGFVTYVVRRRSFVPNLFGFQTIEVEGESFGRHGRRVDKNPYENTPPLSILF